MGKYIKKTEKGKREVVEWLYITVFAKRCAGLAGKWAINKYTVYGIAPPPRPLPLRGKLRSEAVKSGTSLDWALSSSVLWDIIKNIKWHCKGEEGD